jgi:phage terminase small subunit
MAFQRKKMDDEEQNIMPWAKTVDPSIKHRWRQSQSDKAVRSVSDKSQVTEREANFIEEYFVDFDPKAAALRSGCEQEKQGRYMLNKPAVKEVIREKQEFLREKLEISQERILMEWAAIGYARLPDYVKVKGGEASFVDFDELDDLQKAAIESIQIFTSKEGVNQVTKIKLHNKGPALECLSKHLGLFEKDNVQKKHNVNISVDEILSGLPIDLSNAVRKRLVQELDKKVSSSQEVSDSNYLN